jgi:hypothetical protein
MRITKKGSNTVVTLVAGRVDSRWFKSILPVAFEEKGLFQCYFFSFPYKELTATMQGCNYHWRLLNSFSQWENWQGWWFHLGFSQFDW